MNDPKPVEWICQVCGGPPQGDLTRSWIEIKTGGKAWELREGFCNTCGELRNFRKKTANE